MVGTAFRVPCHVGLPLPSGWPKPCHLVAHLQGSRDLGQIPRNGHRQAERTAGVVGGRRWWESDYKSEEVRVHPGGLPGVGPFSSGTVGKKALQGLSLSSNLCQK